MTTLPHPQPTILDIQSRERLTLMLLIGQSFFFGLGLGLLYVVGNTLFLVNYGSKTLPYVYVALGISVSLIFYGLAELQKHWSLNRLSILTIALFMSGCFLAWWLWRRSEARWVAFALMMAFPLGIQIRYVIIGGLAGRLFDIRQMKRLFARVISGSVVGVVCGAFLAIPLLNWVGNVEHLLLFAGAGIGGTLIFLLITLRQFRGELSSVTAESKSQPTAPIWHLFKERFVSTTFFYQMASTMGTQLIIYIFINQAEIQYPNTQDLANFFGNFAGMRNVINIIFLAFLAGPLLNRFGLRFGLAANPGGVAVMIVALSVVALSDGFDGSIFFWLVVVTYIVDMVLSDGITSASVKATYQVLPPQSRSVVETMVEGIGVPVGIGLTGIILLIFNSRIDLTITPIIFFTLAITVVWLTLALLVYGDYPKMLMQTLKKRTFDWAGVSVFDPASLSILEQNLNSPQAGVALYALEGLADVAPDRLPTYLMNLLGHPQPEVRLEALRRIEQLDLTKAIPVLQQRFKNEGSAAVRGALLRTIAVLGGADVADDICPYLNDSNPHLRQGALVGMLRSGEFENIVTTKLTEGLNDAYPDERIFVAQVLAEGKRADYYQPLLKLLQDKEPTVQRAALLAVGKLKQPKLWPTVVECLAVPQLQATAMTALVNGGEPVIPHIHMALTKPGQKRQVSTRLAQILGRIGGTTASTILQTQLEYPDEQVRTHILLALNQCSYQANSDAVDSIQEHLRAELAQTTWLVACLIDLAGSDEAMALLRTTLTIHLNRHRLRTLLWLSFLHNSQTIRQVQDALGLGRSLNGTPPIQTNRQKSYALETLDVLLPPQQKGMILPLAEGLPPTQLLTRLKSYFPQPSHSVESRLQEIITGPQMWLTLWTKAVALDAVAHRPAPALTEVVVSMLASPEPLLRESALWTLNRLEPALAKGYGDKLADDPSPSVVTLAQQVVHSPEGEMLMLSTVEKVLALKTLSFFAEASNDVLAEVAGALKEQSVKAGDIIFKKGDAGHAIYIITEGEVHIHDGRQSIAKLGENEAFGEMSVIDPDPRSATATALKDSHLLRLDQEPFRELLTDHSDIAWRVMQILTRRLRQAQRQSSTRHDPDDLLGSLKKKLTVK